MHCQHLNTHTSLPIVAPFFIFGCNILLQQTISPTHVVLYVPCFDLKNDSDEATTIASLNVATMDNEIQNGRFKWGGFQD